MNRNSDTRNISPIKRPQQGKPIKRAPGRNRGHHAILWVIIGVLTAIVIVALVFIIKDLIKNRKDGDSVVDSSATAVVTTAAETDADGKTLNPVELASASRVIDGDDDTYMLSLANQSVGSYILLDLGTEAEISHVEILSDDAERYVRLAEVQVSSDNVSWSSIGEYKGAPSRSNFTLVSKGMTVRASYVRFALIEKADALWLVNTIRVVGADGNEIVPRDAQSGVITADITVTRAPDATSAVPEGITTLYKSNADVHTGDLILVSTSHEYIFPSSTADILQMYGNRTEFTDESGKTTYSYQIGEIPLTCMQSNALKHFNEMCDAFYKETGITALHVGTNSGWRSYATQADLAAKYSTALAAGLSDHNTGLSANIDLYVDGRVYGLGESALLPLCGQVLLWLTQNSYKYGFVDRYPAAKDAITGLSIDRYHYRYVGYPHAYYMTQNNLCLEEYIDLLGKYTYEGEHLCFTGDDGNSYEIYTIKADTSSTTTAVYVPTALPYTISGDNIGNFVITVTK